MITLKKLIETQRENKYFEYQLHQFHVFLFPFSLTIIFFITTLNYYTLYNNFCMQYYIKFNKFNKKKISKFER